MSLMQLRTLMLSIQIAKFTTSKSHLMLPNVTCYTALPEMHNLDQKSNGVNILST